MFFLSKAGIERDLDMAEESTVAAENTGEDFERVLLRFFGSIREAAGRSDDGLRLIPGTTLYSFLQTVSDVFGREMHDELFDMKAPDRLRDDLMITVNEAIINHAKAGEIILHPGDVVALFPIFPGGG